MGLTDKPDTDHVTLLYREMEICSEYLHCTHKQFKSLDPEEKEIWYLFVEAKMVRQKEDNKKRERDQQSRDAKVRNALSGKNTPEVRDLKVG